MKNCIFLLILFFFFLIKNNAQNGPIEFGKISKSEMEMDHYAEDKDAEALVLSDFGKSYFVKSDNSFDLIFERTTRIKIFSEAGLKYAEVEVPFYQEGGIYEKVFEIEAVTYNLVDGMLKKTALEKSNFHEEKLNNSWNLMKFAMPDVREGSLIEYRYKIKSQYFFNLRDWEFQWKIPVIYSEYMVKMIPFYVYTFYLQGANKFSNQISEIDTEIEQHFGSIPFKDMVHRYIMVNLPAFRDEEFISSISDYIVKIDFQLSKIIYPSGGKVDVLTTWPELIKGLLKNEDFGKYIKKCEKLAENEVDQNTLNGKSEKEKFDIIINHVKTNYKWNKSNSKYVSRSAGNFIKDKIGNSADINLFAIAMLNANGIEAYPLITSTRSNGKIKIDYPFANFFNYVLITAKIDGKIFLSDATNILLANDRIPTQCIHDKGLIIKKDAEDWIGLECNFMSEIKTLINIDSIGENYLVDISTSAKEYDGENYRNRYADDKTSIIEMLNKKDYQTVNESVSIKNYENIDKPYKFEYKMKQKTEIINNKIYLSPFLNEPISENPLKQSTRSYPIDMIYPSTKTYISTISIPKDFKIDHKGEDYNIDNEYFGLAYHSVILGNKLQVDFSYTFKKSVYAAENYQKIKFYFNEIVKRANQKIVFSKI